jgi:hypothetical protein
VATRRKRRRKRWTRRERRQIIKLHGIELTIALSLG